MHEALGGKYLPKIHWKVAPKIRIAFFFSCHVASITSPEIFET